MQSNQNNSNVDLLSLNPVHASGTSGILDANTMFFFFCDSIMADINLLTLSEMFL